jgi:hypothetical protein
VFYNDLPSSNNYNNLCINDLFQIKMKNTLEKFKYNFFHSIFLLLFFCTSMERCFFLYLPGLLNITAALNKTIIRSYTERNHTPM